jgi:small subunit ribosomal protein S17
MASLRAVTSRFQFQRCLTVTLKAATQPGLLSAAASRSSPSSLTVRSFATDTTTPPPPKDDDITGSPIENKTYSYLDAGTDFQDTSYFDNTHLEYSDHFATMSNPELIDTSTIPGWELIHSPPGKLPKGALVGKVVSTKMTKTVNVAVDRYKIVPIYRKRVRYTHKFFAHDEAEVANLGDLVMIVPCHRISKHKHFMLREIVNPKGQL